MICAENEMPLRLQSDKLIVEELPDELMVYDPDRDKAFCLNQTAAFVWSHCDGTRTIAEITTSMGQHTGKPANEQLVRFALNVLAKDGLLAPSSVQRQLASEVTRRALLKQLGVGAAVVPLVTVLLVSPAKAHASGLPSATQSVTSKGKSGSVFGWLNSLL